MAATPVELKRRRHAALRRHRGGRTDGTHAPGVSGQQWADEIAARSTEAGENSEPRIALANEALRALEAREVVLRFGDGLARREVGRQERELGPLAHLSGAERIAIGVVTNIPGLRVMFVPLGAELHPQIERLAEELFRLEDAAYFQEHGAELWLEAERARGDPADAQTIVGLLPACRRVHRLLQGGGDVSDEIRALIQLRGVRAVVEAERFLPRPSRKEKDIARTRTLDRSGFAALQQLVRDHRMTIPQACQDRRVSTWFDCGPKQIRRRFQKLDPEGYARLVTASLANRNRRPRGVT